MVGWSLDVLQQCLKCRGLVIVLFEDLYKVFILKEFFDGFGSQKQDVVFVESEELKKDDGKLGIIDGIII